MVPTMVLCAGLGTRLSPLTAHCAKALVPIGDRPMLAHVLDAVAGVAGPVIVNAHHCRDDIQEFATRRGGLVVSIESELLGTAGGVAHAAAMLGPSDVLLWNGDICADVELPALITAHRVHGAEATLVVRARPRGDGAVGLGDGDRIVRLRNERVAEEVLGGDFLGIHILGSTLRARLPVRGCLVGDVYIPALRRGDRLRAYRHHAPFLDIGTVERYVEANVAWLAQRQLSAWIAPGGYVGPNVVLQQSLVGEGAIVGGSGVLARCVVWPGAVALAPLVGAVVTG